MAHYLAHSDFERAVLGFHLFLKRQPPAVAAELLAVLDDPEPGPESRAVIAQYERLHPSTPVTWLSEKK